eukprot:5826066-Lingulodinium_polyedra.AAC.1
MSWHGVAQTCWRVARHDAFVARAQLEAQVADPRSHCKQRARPSKAPVVARARNAAPTRTHAPRAAATGT